MFGNEEAEQKELLEMFMGKVAGTKPQGDGGLGRIRVIDPMGITRNVPRYSPWPGLGRLRVAASVHCFWTD